MVLGVAIVPLHHGGERGELVGQGAAVSDLVRVRARFRVRVRVKVRVRARARVRVRVGRGAVVSAAVSDRGGEEGARG